MTGNQKGKKNKSRRVTAAEKEAVRIGQLIAIAIISCFAAITGCML